MEDIRSHRSLAVSLAAVAATFGACTTATMAKADPPPPNAQMGEVLHALASLHGKPIEKCTPAEARKQPGPPDAVKLVLKKQGKPITPEPVAKVVDIKIPGAAGMIPARVYNPGGEKLPIAVYYHGGGWVIANINAYDSSCRAIANLAKCIVISVGYRQAPEFKFPAAHEDSYVAFQYIAKHADKFGGDPARIAVVGESAGGNLATAVCLMAKDRKGIMPDYEVLVYPVTDVRTDFPSCVQNAKAKPLDTPMLTWFYKYTLGDMSKGSNKYFSVLRNPNLKGLPSATIITAQIDPLHDEGKAYADKLTAAGVTVQYKNYDGVTHEFFGMGAVVDEAKDAEGFAADGLKSAFSGTSK